MIRKISVLTIALSFCLALFTPAVQASGTKPGTFMLPKGARALSDTVYDLGDRTDPKTNKQVHGLAFITPRANAQKPSGAGGKPGGNACYSLLSSGLKWKTTEPWLIDPTNNRGLNQTDVFNHLANDLSTWENAAGNEIFGSGSIASGLTAEQSGSPDGQNEIMFGNIAQANVIAVTITWGIYQGPPQSREIVEWDQIYDQNDFDWSLSGEAGKMDFDNIATHETGHAAGLGHPDNSCTEETMYAYATEGEIKKRDLAPGDIAGINQLY